MNFMWKNDNFIIEEFPNISNEIYLDMYVILVISDDGGLQSGVLKAQWPCKSVKWTLLVQSPLSLHQTFENSLHFTHLLFI